MPFAAAERRLGGPADLLVNAAGVYRVAALRELDAAAWDAVLAVNLRGAFLVGAGVRGAARDRAARSSTWPRSPPTAATPGSPRPTTRRARPASSA